MPMTPIDIAQRFAEAKRILECLSPAQRQGLRYSHLGDQWPGSFYARSRPRIVSADGVSKEAFARAIEALSWISKLDNVKPRWARAAWAIHGEGFTQIAAGRALDCNHSTAAKRATRGLQFIAARIAIAS